MTNPIIIIDITGGTVHTVDSLLAAAVMSGSSIVTALNSQLGSTVWQTHPSGSDLVTALNSQLGSTVWQGGGSGTPAWGAIVGTLADQTDLDTALDGKAASVHTHVLEDLTDIDVTADMVAFDQGIRPGLYDDLDSPPVGTIFEGVNDGHLYWCHRDGSVHLLCDSGGYGGGAWGSITGTLSDQTDLQDALDLKQNQSSLLDGAVALWDANADIMVFSTASSVGGVTVPSYFRTVMGSSDSATARAALGLTIGSTVQPYDADLAAIAGLTSAADTVVYYTGSGTAALMTVTTAARALLNDANAAEMRTTLGLVIGSNVQPYDAELAAIAGLTSAANKGIYFTGSGAAATFDLSSFGRTLVDDADAAAARATLGLTLGFNVQAYAGMLQNIASCPQPFDEFIYYDSSGVATRTAITTAGRNLLDDASVSAMVDTLGGAAATGTGGLVRSVSPALTGTPTVPTASAGTNTTQAASTAFVTAGLRTLATPGLRASRYYGSFAAPAVTTFTMVANRLYYFPFFCPDAATWTRIGINVTTGAAGNARLGIYTNSNGVPSGSPLVDAGTVDVSTTGEKEITISHAMAVGWYWLAVVSDVAPTVTAENISAATLLCNVGSLSGAAGNVTHIYQSFTFGALPTPSSITGANTTSPIRVWLRL